MSLFYFVFNYVDDLFPDSKDFRLVTFCVNGNFAAEMLRWIWIFPPKNNRAKKFLTRPLRWLVPITEIQRRDRAGVELGRAHNMLQQGDIARAGREKREKLTLSN